MKKKYEPLLIAIKLCCNVISTSLTDPWSVDIYVDDDFSSGGVEL